MAISPLFAQAEEAHRRGRVADAVRILNTLLAGDPGAVAPNVLLGVIHAQSRDLAAAARCLKRALETDPDCIEALVALSTVYKVLDPAKAIPTAEQAVRIQPQDADLYFHLGILHIDFRQFAPAAEAFRMAYELAPWNLDALRNQAMALRDSGREFDAVEVLERLIGQDPANVPGLMNLGQLYLAHGRFADAIATTDKVLSQSPDHATAHLMKALALAEDGRGSEAEPHLEKAIQLNPKDGVANASLGFWYQEQGRFAEAKTVLEKAIALNPRHGFAYYNLFRAKKATEEDSALLNQIEATARDPRLHPRDRGYMHYALGKAYEDRQDYERAMKFYDLGNQAAYEVWLARKPWDKTAYSQGFEKTRAIFTANRLQELAASASPEDLPVMIVGMIRSGTSLLEQILSSHPAVAGAGELPYWHKHEDESLENGVPDPAKLAALAETYVADLRAFAPGAQRVTDKLPHNYAMLGLIHAALPNARMIHVRRNPTDNCLSVYTTAYQRPPVFAHNRENIVFAYREYLKLMAHWRAVLPADRFMEVDYEEMVADREGVTRRIIEFVGLEWDDACLRHESNQRAVRTPSLWQVRQPIYTTSISRWKRFEEWIPEFAALSEEG